MIIIGIEDIGIALSHGWNAFNQKAQQAPTTYYEYGIGETRRPDRVRMTGGNERSIVTSIYNRIAMDAASNAVHHVRLDDDDNFKEIIKSSMDYALSQSANLDQTGTALMQDAIMSMFDEGSIAVVPVDTTLNPAKSGSWEIQTLRVGKILEWYPKHVKVSLYNEDTGRQQEITLEKKQTAIVENPLYSVMNERNSTLQRLIRKLNLLDAIDEQSGSSKLDLIIQLPYIIKSAKRKEEAEKRLTALEDQLKGSKYGVGYIDGTEKVTQLNRPVENNLMGQIEYLTKLLWNQLGMTENIFNGTADEAEMLNYMNRTIAPIMDAFTNEFDRKFLTKTARSQQQKTMWFNDPFKLVPIANLAEIADKFTRNEILTSNEFRSIVGRKPSDQPGANELRNKNLNQKVEEDITKEGDNYEEE